MGDSKQQRGRGAPHNPRNRYHSTHTDAFDDGWGSLDEAAPPLRTTVTPEASRTIVTTNQSPDVPFDRSINPYKGCEHGCVYCFARPTHAYLDLSPGLDFESRIVSKPDGPALLRKHLRKRGYVPETIAIGANTDPYQPAERDLGITRGLLEVFLEFSHPVALVTKSNMILRDLDLWSELGARGLGAVMISVTTLDRTLARRMEPRAPAPERRVAAIRALSEAGVPVGVLASPMIPALNDGELEAILEACAGAGARRAGYILVRLPLEIKELFDGWLDEHYPLKKQHVLNLIRGTRGGELYQSGYGTRMRGTGPYADLLRRRFDVACKRLGLNEREYDLDASQFAVPPQAGDQLSLL